jgi:SPP1 gp7 family putative phage head morphogenesis protein
MGQSARGKIARSYPSPLNDVITVGPNRFTNLDIGNWVRAVNAARDPNHPRRKLLYELYESIMLDAHLQAVAEKRKTAITNQKVHWEPKLEDGQEPDKALIEKINDTVLRTPWFNELLGHAMDAIIYGHSLIELIPEKGVINKVALLNRANVIPELGFLFLNYFNEPSKSSNGKTFDDGKPLDASLGIYYRTDPAYSDFLIEVGGKKDYGKLMSAAQYVIYKRGGFGDWAQFAEIFGSPFFFGKYNPFDPESRKKLEEGLNNMAGKPWAVIPDGSSIDKIDTNQAGKSEVFKDLISVCNEEISKLVLGNTLTTNQGDKGARSLGDVHKEVEEDMAVSDMIRIEYMLNGDFKNKLTANGNTDVAKGRFFFPETSTIPLQERIIIDTQLARLIPLSESELRKTYGAEKPKPGEIPVRISSPAPLPGSDPNNPEDKSQEPGAAEKKKLSRNDTGLHLKLSALYSHSLKHPMLKLAAEPKKKIESIWDRIAKDIHDGKLKAGDVDPDLVKWTSEQLVRGVMSGYNGDSKTPTTYSVSDEQMLDALNENVHVFSGFKSYHELREAADLLKDENGNLKSFAKFREDVLAVNEKYNVTYLEAEYQQAIAASQAASQWIDIEDGKESQPMLTFRTAGDDAVRPEHAALEGATYPVDDPFWDIYYPPLDWGCRCDVIQGDSEAVPAAELPEVKEMFAVNWGKEEVVFPEGHPYYDVSAEEKKNINDQLDEQQ